MFTQGFLNHEMQELELEMERHCIALGMDFSDKQQVHYFAGDLLQNINALKIAAGGGDMQARIKVELYGLAMLMHHANLEKFGDNYMSQLDQLAQQEAAWVALSKAMWQ